MKSDLFDHIEKDADLFVIATVAMCAVVFLFTSALIVGG